MVSTPEGITDNSTMAVVALDTMNNPSARKLLLQFLALLDVKQKLLSSEWDIFKKIARKS